MNQMWPKFRKLVLTLDMKCCEVPVSCPRRRRRMMGLGINQPSTATPMKLQDYASVLSIWPKDRTRWFYIFLMHKTRLFDGHVIEFKSFPKKSLDGSSPKPLFIDGMRKMSTCTFNEELMTSIHPDPLLDISANHILNHLKSHWTWNQTQVPASSLCPMQIHVSSLNTTFIHSSSAHDWFSSAHWNLVFFC